VKEMYTAHTWAQKQQGGLRRVAAWVFAHDSNSPLIAQLADLSNHLELETVQWAQTLPLTVHFSCALEATTSARFAGHWRSGVPCSCTQGEEVPPPPVAIRRALAFTAQAPMLPNSGDDSAFLTAYLLNLLGGSSK